MPNRLRYRSGAVQLHRLRVESDTVLSAGDLVFLDGNVIRPASDFTWNTDLATTQADFAVAFLGVCHQPSAAGETDDVSVDLSPDSVYEVDVAAGTFEVGDILGPDETSSALANQRLAPATNGIARAAEYHAVDSSVLRVRFASAFHPGSSNGNAALG